MKSVYLTTAVPPTTSSSSTLTPTNFLPQSSSSSSTSDVSSSCSDNDSVSPIPPSTAAAAAAAVAPKVYYPAASRRSRSLLSPQIEVEQQYDSSGGEKREVNEERVKNVLIVPLPQHKPLSESKSSDGCRRTNSNRRRQARSIGRLLSGRGQLRSLNTQSPFSSLETSFEEGPNNAFCSPADSSSNINNSGSGRGSGSGNSNNVASGSTMSVPFSSSSCGGSRRSSRRGSRLPSFRGSCDSENWSSGGSGSSSGGGHGDLAAAKSNYRIMVLGASRVGKTSIVRQFLYDQFSPQYRETAAEDMYRGEFEIQGQVVGFDIQDVSGGYVYEFPGMRNVSLSSADAFVLVFSLADAASWEEVSRLRDMVLEVKTGSGGGSGGGGGDTESATPEAVVPMVVVGNKCDLEPDVDVPRDSLEAIVTFDWENGYVESSAKERRNINKIFKELLQQAKSRYDFTVPQMVSASALVNASSARGARAGADPAASFAEEALKRRQSLPAVPAGFAMTMQQQQQQQQQQPHQHHLHNPIAHLLSKMSSSSSSTPQTHSPSGSAAASPCASGCSTPKGGCTSAGKAGKRRSSLAVLRRDSCKIS